MNTIIEATHFQRRRRRHLHWKTGLPTLPPMICCRKIDFVNCTAKAAKLFLKHLDFVILKKCKFVGKLATLHGKICHNSSRRVIKEIICGIIIHTPWEKTDAATLILGILALIEFAVWWLQDKGLFWIEDADKMYDAYFGLTPSFAWRLLKTCFNCAIIKAL